MAKTKKSKKPENSKIEKKKVYKIIVSCVIILLLALLSGLVFKKFTVKENRGVDASNESLSFYDSDKCRCIERERLRCNEGFELDLENRLCRNVNGKEVTNVILGCSKYECSGTVYRFNFENETWE